MEQLTIKISNFWDGHAFRIPNKEFFEFAQPETRFSWKSVDNNTVVKIRGDVEGLLSHLTEKFGNVAEITDLGFQCDDQNGAVATHLVDIKFPEHTVELP